MGFESGEGGTDAVVDSEPEADGADVFAADVEAVGLLELIGIAIGGQEGEDRASQEC